MIIFNVLHLLVHADALNIFVYKEITSCNENSSFTPLSMGTRMQNFGLKLFNAFGDCVSCQFSGCVIAYISFTFQL